MAGKTYKTTDVVSYDNSFLCIAHCIACFEALPHSSKTLAQR